MFKKLLFFFIIVFFVGCTVSDNKNEENKNTVAKDPASLNNLKKDSVVVNTDIQLPPPEIVQPQQSTGMWGSQ